MIQSRSVVHVLFTILCLQAFFSSEVTFAAQKKFTFTLKVPSQIGVVSALSKSGQLFSGSKKGSSVTLAVPYSALNGLSLFAVSKSGRLQGPVLAPYKNKGLLFLVKKPTDRKKKNITKTTLNLSAPKSTASYVLIKSLPKGSLFNSKVSYALSKIPALGLNQVSANSFARATRAKVRAASSGDQDGDGVADSLDVDIDGNGIPNIADAESGSSSENGVNAPFTTLYLPMSQTLNWHIDESLDAGAIDSVIGGANTFAAAFFVSLPPDQVGSITGANVICSGSLSYCRPSRGDQTGGAVYSGFSDGDQSLAGNLWSALSSNGHEYGFERMHPSEQGLTLAASFQPRVGPSGFRPGDSYQINLTAASGATVSSRTLVLPPYFLTVPQISAYSTVSSSGDDDVIIDYSDSDFAGMNSSNPIVLASSGEFAGKLRLEFNRLQRLAVSPTESGNFRDFGHLNYGVLISNQSGEFTCGGLYTETSDALTEVESAGQGGSYASMNGAILWPLVDSQDDYDPEDLDNAEIEPLSFTVDLSSCLSRAGGAPGVYQVSLTAAGVDTGHGANRAAQTFSVQIP